MLYVSKVVDRSRGWPEDFLFDTYYAKVQGKALLFPWITPLPLIHTL